MLARSIGRQAYEGALRRRTSLADFVARTPGYTKPEHLRPYIDILERARTEPVRAVISAPPRHGKSETSLGYVTHSLQLDPTDRIGYATYAAEFSEQQGKRALMQAETRGLKLAEKRANFWRTPQGGEAMWTSIGGPLTGKGFRKLLIDDPVKGRAEAESAAYRDAAWDWFNAVAFTRLEPGGSIFVLATRWHPDDLSGRLIAQGWPCINLPALSDDGRALWPERYPAETLLKIREQIGEYEWSALYQGQPRHRGGAVFRDVSLFDVLPSAYRISIGVDFAYTAKTHADYSAAVVLAEYNDQCFVLEVVREQLEAPAFAERLDGIHRRYPGAPMFAFVSGTELGVVDFLKKRGLRIQAIPAKQDKFSRAQPVAAHWNGGRVLLPSSNYTRTSGKPAQWVDAFVTEVCGFTGLGDRNDDQVDALAGAYHPFARPLRQRIEL